MSQEPECCYSYYQHVCDLVIGNHSYTKNSEKPDC